MPDRRALCNACRWGRLRASRSAQRRTTRARHREDMHDETTGCGPGLCVAAGSDVVPDARERRTRGCRRGRACRARPSRSRPSPARRRRSLSPPPPAAHPGEAVYKTTCAACHDNAEATRAPSRDNLKGMSFQFVNYALTQGKMKDMGAALSAEQRARVVSYVTGRDTTKTVDWTPNMMCTGARAAVDLEGPDAATSTHFGYRRRQHAQADGQAGRAHHRADGQHGPGLGDRLPGLDHDALAGRDRRQEPVLSGDRRRQGLRLRPVGPGEALRAVGLHHAGRRAAAHQHRLWRAGRRHAAAGVRGHRLDRPRGRSAHRQGAVDQAGRLLFLLDDHAARRASSRTA